MGNRRSDVRRLSCGSLRVRGKSDREWTRIGGFRSQGSAIEIVRYRLFIGVWHVFTRTLQISLARSAFLGLVKKFLHTRYRVSDVEKTVGFYRDVLGLRKTRRHTSPRRTTKAPAPLPAALVPHCLGSQAA
jgi:Glyoxalase/Bleomycin resistance protein/Dioxygenase superfamily